MSIDVVDLRNFYGQRLGVVARRFIGRGIRNLWPDNTGLRVLRRTSRSSSFAGLSHFAV
jgi:hypothetical protein